MDAEKLMNLFDFYWFHHQIITNSPSPPPLPNPDPEFSKQPPKSDLSPRFHSRHSRSLSDQFSCQASFSSDSSSPKSVLTDYKANPVVLSRETEEEHLKMEFLQRPKVRKQRNSRSKSLSDLEFEELKGFMDLGFVFSKEDRNSRLAAIIPGLQRLGKEEECEQEGEQEEEEEETEEEEMGNAVTRPYLSEAWRAMEIREEEKTVAAMMINWRFPSLSNEIDMKDNLRCWAHSVAAAVR